MDIYFGTKNKKKWRIKDGKLRWKTSLTDLNMVHSVHCDEIRKQLMKRRLIHHSIIDE